jgi:nitrite reductase/ring-hydroxylating ferredoxin subunit
MTYQISNIKIIYVFALILFLFVGCENEQKPFPYVHINETFNVTTELNDLPIGEFMFLGKENGNYGYGGLIIYRSGQNSFQAFDRACTYNPDDKCILERDDEFESLVTCPCCGSKFLVSENGMVFDGPATRRLKNYETYYDPPILRVRN